MSEDYGETSTASPEEITAAEKIRRMLDERESTLRILSKPDSVLAMPLEQAGTRQEAVNIVAAEIAALQALDPNTMTSEQISEISAPYRARLDALPRG